MKCRSLVLLSFLMVACSEKGALAPNSLLTHAIATPSCGPADGPTVVILLAAQPFELPEPASEHVTVTLPVSHTTLVPGRVFEISSSMESAWAFHVYDENTRLEANGGEVKITSVSGSAIAGRLDLRFPGSSRIEGTFKATFQERLTFCG